MTAGEFKPVNGESNLFGSITRFNRLFFYVYMHLFLFFNGHFQTVLKVNFDVNLSHVSHFICSSPELAQVELLGSLNVRHPSTLVR
jgi:hypothetical protein